MGDALADNVVVTGGADSVGRVIAERFLARGDKVHICDIRPAALEETLAANPGMTGTLANVGDFEAVARVFADAVERMGEATVLVNNVGIAGPRAAIEDISLADWQESLQVNLSGMFFCMQRAIPGMKRHGGGAIVNFSTGSTRTRLPHRTPYVVSKFGVEGLTLNAARELGPFHIRCNAILPGMINNARMQGIVAAKAAESRSTIAEVEAGYLKHISMRVQIEPAELADMVLFLASDAARKITGELIAVSGNLEWEE
jgi:NAD(P)-dependent dehydrogenase (short-subunit alcohol dehydrogenase family)